MKTLTNKLSKIVLILFVFVFTNCNKEILQEETTTIAEFNIVNPYTQRVVKLSDIPNIGQYLISNLTEDIFGRTGEEEAIFDVDHILEVIDTLDYANYSFQFRYDDTPVGTFYNLVVGQTPEGENTLPFVLKYTCDDSQLAEFINNDFNLGHFKGIIARHKYTDFFEEGYFSRPSELCPPELDAVGDPIACEIVPIDGSPGGGAASGSGSGSGSGGSGGFGSGQVCLSVVVGVSCTCGPAHNVGDNCDCDNQPYNEIWEICTSSNGTNRASNTTGRTDCPDCTSAAPVGGGVAVNADNALTAITVLKHNLNLGVEGIEWITNPDNKLAVIIIYKFLELFKVDDVYPPESLITAALQVKLAINPNLLLEIDCSQIEHWQTLAQHTAPQSVQDKINELPSSITNDFEIQSLTDANGTKINMDYFPVEISVLPNNPDTGQQFSADELLDYFRRNINIFVAGAGTTFGPYCEITELCQQETDLWNSTNPLSSLVYLDILGDDGVVVCTEYTNEHWYFMTMNAPYAGNHPVSGTRQFGFETNANGGYNFFVRGVDRFNSFILSSMAVLFAQTDPFLAADILWFTFQQNMNDFVNNNGGTSNIGPSVTDNRPNWNKVKDVLLGNLPISELGCN